MTVAYNRSITIGEHGFVRFVDKMGDDAAIVQAARVSYGAGTKSVREDAHLINHLLRNGHTSPFEMVQLKLHISCPIFEARQMVRHRTASWNEVSGRYSVMEDKFWGPAAADLRAQSFKDKQSTEGSVEQAEEASNTIATCNKEAYASYMKLLDLGVGREQARAVLPLSLYTQFYWRVDGNNLMKYLKLRDDHHAQHEIRETAKAIRLIATDLFPRMMEAYEENVGGAAILTKTQLQAVEAMLIQDHPSSWGVDKAMTHKMLHWNKQLSASVFNDLSQKLYGSAYGS
jgi:thymidylate synthase (FAD)